MAALLLACRGPEPAPVPDAPEVALHLDGTPVGVATLADPDARLDLPGLYPEAASDPATWLHLEARARGGRTLHLGAPTAAWTEPRLTLALDAAGAPLLTVHTPVAEGLPPEIARLAAQPVLALEGVESVLVFTVASPPPEAPPTPPLAVRLGDTDLPPLTQAELEEVPTHSGRRRQQGWPLSDVLALRAPVDRIAQVTLEGGDDPLVLQGAALRDPEVIWLLRRNQRGHLRLQEWAGREPGRDLRGVRSVTITLDP